jgi:carbon monoxide dehydrogenase subunit G
VIVRGETTVPIARAELWAVLSDPTLLATALPDADEVSIEDDHHFSAIARPATGLGRTRVVMSFEIVEQRVNDFVRIHGAGTAGENLVDLSVALELADSGEQTDAAWQADVHIRGVMSSLLQRGLGSLVNEQIKGVLAAAASITTAG